MLKLCNGLTIFKINAIHTETIPLKGYLSQNNITTDENLKLIIASNIVGAGISIAKELRNDKKYKELFEQETIFTAILAGNTPGVFVLKSKDNNFLEIETLEHSSSTVKNSVQALITNFVHNLGITDEKKIQALANTEKFEIVLQTRVEFEKNKDSEAIFSLLETGFYNLDDISWNRIALYVDESKPEAKYKFNSSRLHAMILFTETLTELIYYQLKRGIHTFILTGPFIKEFNCILKEAIPCSLCATTLAKQLSNQVNQLIKDDPANQCEAKAYSFDIICDEKIKTNNNTIDGSILLNAGIQFLNPKGQDAHINIPLELLKVRERQS
jgi:hypothetical protein